MIFEVIPQEALKRLKLGTLSEWYRNAVQCSEGFHTYSNVLSYRQTHMLYSIFRHVRKITKSDY